MNEESSLKVYELKEVSKLLKINIRVLREYIKNKKIKASKIGRKYVITEQDLNNFINGSTEEKKATRYNKALLEALLQIADIGKEVIELSVEDFNKLTGTNATEKEVEASLHDLLNLETITKGKIDGGTIEARTSVISSYKKTPKGYEVELSKVLVSIYKKNMLINTKIEKK